MAALGPALMLGSAALSAVGSIAGGQAQARASAYNAAQIENQGREEREAAGFAAADERRRTEGAQSQARSLLAASGVDLGFGTALLAQEDLASEDALRRERIRAGGERSMRRRQGQSAIERSSGQSARRAGFFGAGTSLLSGAFQAMY